MMKIRPIPSILIFLAFLLGSCQSPNSSTEVSSVSEFICPMDCEGGRIYESEVTCPVCGMELVPLASIEKPVIGGSGEMDENSIYNLSSEWKDQHGRDFHWADLDGHPFVMTMIYTTCRSACPRLVADMRSIAEEIHDPDFRYVLISIDPKQDTPEVLEEFASKNQLDNGQWVLLNGNEEDVREVANVIAMKYLRISPLDFSHSNIITLFDRFGVMQYQIEGLGVNKIELISKGKGLE